MQIRYFVRKRPSHTSVMIEATGDSKLIRALYSDISSVKYRHSLKAYNTMQLRKLTNPTAAQITVPNPTINIFFE